MLILPSILWREIEERSRRALPDEACGLLLGMRRGSEVEVAALASARNIALDPRVAFELDPLDAIAAEEGARGVGLAIVGVWHSHPRGPRVPSPEDLRGASSSWLTLIAMPQAHGGIELSCWRSDGEHFAPLEIAQTLSTHG
jgi:proteasome lid subunit RPN8/RPN11